MWLNCRIPKKIEIISTGVFQKPRSFRKGTNVTFGLIPFFFGDCDHWDELPPELGDKGRRTLRRLFCSGGDLCNERLWAIRQASRVQFHFNGNEEGDIWIGFQVFSKGGRKPIFSTSMKISSSGLFLEEGTTAWRDSEAK